MCAQPESLPTHTHSSRADTHMEARGRNRAKQKVCQYLWKWFVILGKVLRMMKYLQSRSLTVHHCSLPRGEKTYLKERADELTL